MSGGLHGEAMCSPWRSQARPQRLLILQRDLKIVAPSLEKEAETCFSKIQHSFWVKHLSRTAGFLWAGDHPIHILCCPFNFSWALQDSVGHRVNKTAIWRIRFPNTLMIAESELELWGLEKRGPQRDGHCCFSVGRCLDSPPQFSSSHCQSCFTLRRGLRLCPPSWVESRLFSQWFQHHS